MNPTNDANLSEAIRIELRANPNLTAKPGIALLASKGIVVTPGLFNTVKFHFGKDGTTKTKAKAPKAKAPTVAPAPQNVLNTATLDAAFAAVAEVKALAQKIGPDVLRKIAATV